MAMFEITEMRVGPQNLHYLVHIAEGYPLTTQDDQEAINRILALMPALETHVCVSPAGDSFKDALPCTDVAHVLEHVVVELLAQSGRVEIASGKTRTLPDSDGRSFESCISCEDDTLTIAAVSSAVWVLEWAFAGGKAPSPHIAGIAEGLGALIDTVDRVPHTSTARAR